MSLQIGGGGTGGGTSTSTSTIEGSLTTTENAASQASQTIGSGSSETNLVIGAGTTIAPGGIQLQIAPTQSIAAMGTLATTGLEGGLQLAAAGTQGSLQNAAAEQAAASQLASQATPVNTSDILWAVGGIIVLGIIAWGLTHNA